MRSKRKCCIYNNHYFVLNKKKDTEWLWLSNMFCPLAGHPIIINSPFQYYVQSSYLLTSTFRHAKQTRRIKIHHSLPTSMIFWTCGLFPWNKIIIYIGCDWLVLNGMLRHGYQKSGAMHKEIRNIFSQIMLLLFKLPFLSG